MLPLIKDKHTIPYPETPNFQFLVLARSGLEKGSDYGLLKKCQNEKMQFFMANRFPLLPGQNSANLGGKRAQNQNSNRFASPASPGVWLMCAELMLAELIVLMLAELIVFECTP